MTAMNDFPSEVVQYLPRRTSWVQRYSLTLAWLSVGLLVIGIVVSQRTIALQKETITTTQHTAGQWQAVATEWQAVAKDWHTTAEGWQKIAEGCRPPAAKRR